MIRKALEGEGWARLVAEVEGERERERERERALDAEGWANLMAAVRRAGSAAADGAIVAAERREPAAWEIA